MANLIEIIDGHVYRNGDDIMKLDQAEMKQVDAYICLLEMARVAKKVYK